MTERGSGRRDAAERATVFAVCAALVVAVAALYVQSARFSFVSLDDYYLLVLRPEVRGGLTAANVRWALTAVEPQVTKLAYVARATVGGKMAQIGSRLIDATARKMADDFFGKFVALMTPGETAAG